MQWVRVGQDTCVYRQAKYPLSRGQQDSSEEGRDQEHAAVVVACVTPEARALVSVPVLVNKRRAPAQSARTRGALTEVRVIWAQIPSPQPRALLPSGDAVLRKLCHRSEQCRPPPEEAASFFRRFASQVQTIQGTGCSPHLMLRYVEIAGRSFQAAMPHQDLDGT